MERKINKLILLLLIPLISMAGSPGEEIYNAYISGNMKHWEKVLSGLQNTNRLSNEQRFERVNYQYGFIAWCIGNKKYTKAREWIPRMEADLEYLEKAGFEPSSVYAYKAALYGYRIGVNKLQAPFLGPKSNEYAKKAVRTDPSNPLGHQQVGNIMYYTPFLFGGSEDDAEKHLLKAMTLMEANPGKLKWNWNYLSLLTSIAEMYYKSDKRERALYYLQKALKTEPGYEWVKEELYPLYVKKH